MTKFTEKLLDSTAWSNCHSSDAWHYSSWFQKTEERERERKGLCLVLTLRPLTTAEMHLSCWGFSRPRLSSTFSRHRGCHGPACWQNWHAHPVTGYHFQTVNHARMSRTQSTTAPAESVPARSAKAWRMTRYACSACEGNVEKTDSSGSLLARPRCSLSLGFSYMHWFCQDMTITSFRWRGNCYFLLGILADPDCCDSANFLGLSARLWVDFLCQKSTSEMRNVWSGVSLNIGRSWIYQLICIEYIWWTFQVCKENFVGFLHRDRASSVLTCCCTSRAVSLAVVLSWCAWITETWRYYWVIGDIRKIPPRSPLWTTELDLDLEKLKKVTYRGTNKLERRKRNNYCKIWRKWI